MSGCVRISDEIDASVLNRKCGLIWLASASIARGEQQLLLFLQPVLDARVVPDLDRRRHTQRTVREQDDRSSRRREVGVQHEQAVVIGPALADGLTQQLERDRREQQHDLPVDLQRADHLPGAAMQRREDERREVPDGFLGAELAQAAAARSRSRPRTAARPISPLTSGGTPTIAPTVGAGVGARDQAGDERAPRASGRRRCS